MTYTEQFTDLTGVTFAAYPTPAYATITQPIASTARVSILPIYGYCTGLARITFPSPTKINSLTITFIGSSGTFGEGSVGDYLNFRVGVQPEAGAYRYSVINPTGAVVLTTLFDVDEPVDYVEFGIQRSEAIATAAYADIDSVVIDYNEIIPPATTTKGFYRYKIANANAGRFPVYFLRDGAFVASQCINFREHCTSGKVLKFMDRNGLYRFFPFNEFWEQNNEPDTIGSTELFTDSIYTGQSNKRSLGYKNKRSIAAVAYEVTAYELDILQDLMTSPFVYLYIGTTGDAPKDWLLVEVSGTNTGRRRKGVIGRYEVTIVLPEQFNITML